MLMPVIQDVAPARRARPAADRLHLLRLDGLPLRAGVQLRVDPRRGRALAADPGEPRRDGRGLGAVRGLGEAPARRRRHRPRLLLREVGSRTDPRGPLTPARPVPRRPALAGRHQPRRPPGPSAASTAARRGRRTSARWRHAAGATPCTTPTPSWRGTSRSRTSSRWSRSWTRCARATARRSPTAPVPWSSRPTTEPESCAPGPHGSAGSTTGSSRWPSVCATSPSRSPPARPVPRRGRQGRFDVAELHAPVQPAGADHPRGPRAGRPRQREPLGRRTGGQPGDGGRSDPHRRGGPAHHRRHGEPGCRPRHVRSRACNRTWSPSWKASRDGFDDEAEPRRRATSKRPSAACGGFR